MCDHLPIELLLCLQEVAPISEEICIIQCDDDSSCRINVQNGIWRGTPSGLTSGTIESRDIGASLVTSGDVLA